ncbi:adenylate cyclase [Cyanidiococcus yangmingshanensis]|uniref:Adenylate cyclase n=1 Tax=Cyanidiococcus yangmingshanensis TaxID=2690220 RepID=A0A7J7IBD1_9RHOD|nr:adenylate cyclase [Cyanidiococcus yangmingshanensis]
MGLFGKLQKTVIVALVILVAGLWSPFEQQPRRVLASPRNATSVALETLQAYLRIDTAQPHPHYRRAVRFLQQVCKQVGLDTSQQFAFQRGRLGVVCSLRGREPHLGAVVLSSHLDVVPAESSSWRLAPPFSAAIVNGCVVARGAQDMKTQGVQYLEALRRLRTSAPNMWPFRRTVHVLFVPDEEVGGHTGMGLLVNSSLWRDTLRPAVLIDECLPEPRAGIYKVCCGERQPWWMTIRTKHRTAHGGTLPADTAIQRLYALLTRILEYRERERLAVEHGKKALGQVLGVNVVHWASGGNGNATNVIPSEAELRLDMRVPPHLTETQVLTTLENWMQGTCVWLSKDQLSCANATFQVQFIDRVIAPFQESVDETASALYRAIATAARAEHVRLEPYLFPMSTDSRYVRQAAVPAYGIMALDGVAQGPQLHQPDECVPLHAFERGIQFYMTLVRHLADESDWKSPFDEPKTTPIKASQEEL